MRLFIRLAVLLGPLGAVGSCGAPTSQADPVPMVSSTASAAIQELAGCFEVSWRFVEDGVHDIFAPDYGLITPTKEWVGLRRTGDATFQLQHVLFAGPRPLAHWYEVWTQQPSTEDWTQEVWGGTPGPDSDVRYGCTAPWVGNRWECHAGRAEKPLRDEARDYDWLDRTNILHVTPKGFVQNEHNRKMRASGDVVSSELGWITYTRLAEEQCARGDGSSQPSVSSQPASWQPPSSCLVSPSRVASPRPARRCGPTISKRSGRWRPALTSWSWPRSSPDDPDGWCARLAASYPSPLSHCASTKSSSAT